MREKRAQAVQTVAWLVAASAALLAVLGAVHNYSAAPHWDMWHGTTHFYTLVSAGKLSAFWDLHNEHRIVLARLLFWLDYEWFAGRHVFLVVMNFVLVLGAFFTWLAIVRHLAGREAGSPQVQVVLLAIFTALFSWVQWENLTWAFQSQFFLAQWLPLVALYLLYRARIETGEDTTRFFAGACVVAVLCMGTMASGVMTLPLLLAYAFWERMGARRIATLGLLSALLIPLYLLDFQTPQGHSGMGDLSQQPAKRVVQYVLVYLGSPFYHLLGSRSLALTQAFGLVLVGVWLWQGTMLLRRRGQDPMRAFLVAYIGYIVATASVTGVGRIVFGLHQATASRYTTPALMAWIAMAVLFLPALLRGLKGWRLRALVPLAAVLALLMTYQARASQSQRPLVFEREVAALGVVLDVRDEQQIRHSYFNALFAMAAYRAMPDQDKSIFGVPVIHAAKTSMDRPLGPLPPLGCRAVLVDMAALETAPGWRRVTGWVAPQQGRNAVDAIRLADASGQVVGYALAGELMAHPLHDDGQGPDSRPFKGYLRTEAAEGPLTLVASGSPCTASLPARRASSMGAGTGR